MGRYRTITALIGAGSLTLAACGGSDDATDADPAAAETTVATTEAPMIEEAEENPELPTIVASTTIWADVVSNVVCFDLAEVTTVVPAGVDSHGFEPSLQDRGLMEQADLLVVNGLNLEEGLAPTIDAVALEGVPLFAITDHVSDLIEYDDDHGHDDHGHDHGHDDHGHDDKADDDHGHDDHGHDDHGHDDHGHDHGHDDHGHDHGHDDHGHDDKADDDHGHDDHGHDDHGHSHDGDDPHVWFDPLRVASAVPALADFIIANTDIDADSVNTCADAYVETLVDLDAEIDSMLAGIPDEMRRLVTTHEALGYFADRYDFEILGTALPGTSSLAAANPADLEDLAQQIAATGITAVFAEAEVSDADLQAVADRLGDVRVIPLLTEALGPEGSDTGTYVEFMTVAAATIAGGLSS